MGRATRIVNREKRKQGLGDGGADRPWIEVGTGPYVVMTVPRSDGVPVMHRFETQAEAHEQHLRNMSEDRPLVGHEGSN